MPSSHCEFPLFDFPFEIPIPSLTLPIPDLDFAIDLDFSCPLD